jgi:hypothetical protein
MPILKRRAITIRFTRSKNYCFSKHRTAMPQRRRYQYLLKQPETIRIAPLLVTKLNNYFPLTDTNQKFHQVTRNR